MTIEDLMLHLVLSVLAASFVIFIIKIIEMRRWLYFIFVLLLFSMAILLPSIPKFPFKINTEIKLIPFVLSIFIIGLIIALILYRMDFPKRDFDRLLKWFERWSRNWESLSKGWQWTSDSIKKIIKNSENVSGLDIKNLPMLMFVSDYSVYSLTDLRPGERMSAQIAVYHTLDSEEYISWVDATYWAILRCLSNIGILVKIYISKKPGVGNVYYQYIKAIAGARVMIDEDIYDRFSVLSSEESPANLNTSGKELIYKKLTAFARLLPMLMGSRHTWILIWEGYYEKYFEGSVEELSQPIDLTFPSTSQSELQGSRLSIRGFKTAYLIFPTATGIDENGNEFKINPSETFLLGEGDSSFVYNRIKFLSNASLKCIVREIMGPLMSGRGRFTFNLLFSVILILRSDRAKGTALNYKDYATKFIAWMLSKANHSIHFRMAK